MTVVLKQRGVVLELFYRGSWRVCVLENNPILGVSNVVMASVYCNLVSFGSKLWERPGELKKKKKKKRFSACRMIFELKCFGFRKLCILLFDLSMLYLQIFKTTHRYPNIHTNFNKLYFII